MRPEPPGAWRPTLDRWGSLSSHAERFPRESLVVVDERVHALHPAVGALLREVRPHAVVPLRAGERAKSTRVLDAVLEAARALPRSGAMVCIGGGSLGDLTTVAAHLVKRGVRLVQVPSTLLAAVDSSLGGKGAVNVGRGPSALKNGAGVFHYADECWLCPELFTTLKSAQLRDGATEAWKMAVCLDAPLWRAWTRRAPSLVELVKQGRRLKDAVCAEDPYEQLGRRALLNFGHTFGHVLESLSRYRVSHGDAVGLGTICALDVGRAVGATSSSVADEVEEIFEVRVGAGGRDRLARLLGPAPLDALQTLLRGDKKTGTAGELRMVLLRRLGDASVVPVPAKLWRRLSGAWKRGRRP